VESKTLGYSYMVYAVNCTQFAQHSLRHRWNTHMHIKGMVPAAARLYCYVEGLSSCIVLSHLRELRCP
jgi:hypothetical protein